MLKKGADDRAHVQVASAVVRALHRLRQSSIDEELFDVIATAGPEPLTALLEDPGEAVLRLGQLRGLSEGLRMPT